MAQETEQLKLDRQICTEGERAIFDEPGLGQYYVGEKDGRVVCSTLITYEWSDHDLLVPIVLVCGTD